MQVVEPSSGGNRLKFFYAAPAPDKQRIGVLRSLCAIKAEAERINAGIGWHPTPEKTLQREQHA